MDSYKAWPAAGDERAIRFTGNWREYLPIAATNVALIIVTLGIYRFWATARQRRYLWSRTHVVDDGLEWTGTGKEMFFGFLMVVAFILPFFLFIQFLFPALVARGKEAAAGGLMFLFYIGFFYLAGVARFRALRYRLSRTWWHGIRGGSDNPGWNYGGEYLGRQALSAMTMFIMFPGAATRLWNSRWQAMSFGPLTFKADLTAKGLKARWALIYIAPILLIGVSAAIAMIAITAKLEGQETDPGKMAGFGAVLVSILVLFYIVLPLATMHWFAKFYRNAAAATTLGEIEFGFDATTWDWVKLFLGNLGLAIITLGFGLAFWGYRNWAFMVRHMHLYGVVNLDTLTRSTVAAPREAEGWADAFDVGAI